MICPYCNYPAECLRGSDVYKHRPELWHKWFHVCRVCDARVGCHGDTQNALGRMANKELREAKIAAHAVFDPLWKSGKMTRRNAYAWLATRLGINQAQCHIGEFDVEQCRAVVSVVNALKERP